MKKLTQREVYKRFKSKGWKLIGKYIDANTKIKAKCPHCSKITIVKPSDVFNGHTTSCGCVSRKIQAQKRSTSPKEKSLGYLYPNTIKLYSKNNKKSIYEIYPNSHKKYLWICEECNNEYESAPMCISMGKRCPYCKGLKILKGFNDLQSQRPDLIKEWHPTKNRLKPTEVTCNSGKRIWWICNKCSYEWKVDINNRIYYQSGCPNCHPQSYIVEEIKGLLYKWNINFEIEKTFSTCKNKNKLRFDFWLSNHNLLIEFNGKQHYKLGTGYYNNVEQFKTRKKRDKIKENWCKENNIDLLIIPYWEKDNIEKILQERLFNE